MDEAIKAKWLEALRSGKYRQTTGRLRREEKEGTGYCCLGVLCDLSGLGEWQGSTYVVNGVREPAVLPRPVYEWAGLTNPDPRVEDEFLSTMNDAYMSFATIANKIEEGL